MKILWVTLNVDNMEESIAFYRDVIGLRILRRMEENGNDIAYMGDGETKVELMCSKNHASKLGVARHVTLAFQVNSIYEMMETLIERGIPVHGGPYQPNARIRFFYVLDPNGVKIQFVENLIDYT